jgi:hypothetical protein
MFLDHVSDSPKAREALWKKLEDPHLSDWAVKRDLDVIAGGLGRPITTKQLHAWYWLIVMLVAKMRTYYKDSDVPKNIIRWSYYKDAADKFLSAVIIRDDEGLLAVIAELREMISHSHRE